MSTKLSWDKQFALIEAYKPTDEMILQAFNVSQAELNTARKLKETGNIKTATSSEFNTEDYGNPFLNVNNSSTVTSTTKPTSTKTATKSKAPETATKRVVAPKKRGRKGTKIDEAFRLIPNTPVSVEDFSKQYGVSIPVLRQSKRFDKSRDLGDVRVKVNKDTGKLMIWRDNSKS